MLNQSHHRTTRRHNSHLVVSTRVHQHPEEPDVRPTSPVL